MLNTAQTSVNAHSLKSKRKQTELHGDPGTVSGTKNSDHFTSKIFSTTHDHFRKDKNKFGGGVFIGAKKDLLAMHDDNMIMDCDSVWVRIVIAGKQLLHIGSFSRSTDSEPNPLVKLDESLKKLTGKTTPLNIISAGDFNGPDLSWENNTINNNTWNGTKLNQTLPWIANKNMLSKHRDAATTGDNSRSH